MNTLALVARLRELAATHDGGWSLNKIAADTIERLELENAKLRTRRTDQERAARTDTAQLLLF